MMSDKQGQQLGLTHPFKTSRKRISVTFLTQFSALTTFVSFNSSYNSFQHTQFRGKLTKLIQKNYLIIFNINSYD